MGFNLRSSPKASSLPGAIRIDSLIGQPEGSRDIQDLPYYNPTVASRIERLTSRRPRDVWYFAATLSGEPDNEVDAVMPTRH